MHASSHKTLQSGGMAMNKTLDLLDETDRLLDEADENLKALEALKVDVKLAKIQALVAKHQSVSLVLNQRKRELLVALIQLSLTIGVADSNGYHFSSDNIFPDDKHCNFVIEDFCRNSDYQALCRGIFEKLETYLKVTPETQKAERQFVESLVSGLSDFFKGKRKGK